MKSKLLITITLILFLSITGFLIYANNVLLPKTLKLKITQKLELVTGKNVEIKKLHYNIFKGLIVEDVAIFDKNKEKTYLTVKELSFNPLLLPLLQKSLVIPLLRIESPQINLVRRLDNTLNISDIIKNSRSAAGQKTFSVLIYKIDIDNGKCQFKDEHLPSNYGKEITDMKIGLELKKITKIKFILHAAILNFSTSPSFVSAEGEYNLLNKELDGRFKINHLFTNDYLLYLEKTSLGISQGVINADLLVTLKNKLLNIQGTGSVKDLRLKKEQFTLSGNVNLEPQISYDLDKKELKYKSRLQIADARIAGFEYIKDVSEIRANLYLDENKLLFEDLKASILDSPLELKGNVNFADNKLGWENLNFIFKEMQYNTTGSLVDFQKPKIDMQLQNKDLDLKTNLDFNDGILRINSCEGKYLNSLFDLKGNIQTKDNFFNLKGKLNLNIRDILGIMPKDTADKLKDLKPDGNCTIQGIISGNPQDLKNISANLEFSSHALTVYDLKLNEISFKVRQKDKLIDINNLTASAYSGNIQMTFNMDLRPQEPAYRTKISISGLDLAKLKLDTKLKDGQLSGILNLVTNLNGEAKKLQTLKGQGKISIKDGKLWELNLFKGLGELLFMPIYQNITFNDASANFSIQDQNIQISDGFLGSKEIDFGIRGKAGFDGSLDITLQAEINEDLITESPDLRKFTSLIVGNLLAIKIGGTSKKPEYKVVATPTEIVNQIKRLLLPN